MRLVLAEDALALPAFLDELALGDLLALDLHGFHVNLLALGLLGQGLAGLLGDGLLVALVTVGVILAHLVGLALGLLEGVLAAAVLAQDAHDVFAFADELAALVGVLVAVLLGA